MTWFRDNSSVKTPVASAERDARRHQHIPHIEHDVEERLAKFLISHERLQERRGRPLMHLLGVSHNDYDGTTDYAIRSRVHDADGKDRRFDSTIRIYPTGHLRLLR
jgi:hypothetical protein